MNLDKKKVVLGLSGGVDSATAALTLKEQGYTVIGLYFDVRSNNGEGRAIAEQTAKEVGIEFVYKDVSQLFSDVVIQNFCDEYQCGRTPNPCIVCNPTVKFKTLMDEANRQGAYYMATGHYARVSRDEEKAQYFIQRGVNERKDQSYMLYRLPEEIVKRLILPLGAVEEKEQVREIARAHHLGNADRKDSQEICFIDDNYVDYLNRAGVHSQPGDFVDQEGKVLGQHQGLVHYTIGQRKGLGITFGKPVFVTKLDGETNQVTLGDNDALFTHEVRSTGNVFVGREDGRLPEELEGAEIFAKVRYSAQPAKAVISSCGKDEICVTFSEKQRAATPGQSIVFYQNNHVIGGGFIQ
ncbi:MAG: tRNA 2-thiouridine(34) synthase MnmA [Anaerovoracaceae bacterium]